MGSGLFFILTLKRKYNKMTLINAGGSMKITEIIRRLNDLDEWAGNDAANLQRMENLGGHFANFI